MPTHMLMLGSGRAVAEAASYFEAEAGMSYYRFPINLWMQYVTRCMPVPSNHSNVRIQGLHERVYKCARSTPVESILEFLKPFFDFVDDAVDSGRSVLVHCVAGAHRAATAGCLLLMHYHQLGAKVRVHTAPTVMPTPPPWSLHSLWVRPDRMPRRSCASCDQ